MTSNSKRPRQTRRAVNADRKVRPGDGPLARWLIRNCAERELSWAEASRRSGLFAGAISSFVRGTRPGLAACKALGDFFDVPTEHVLMLAEHTPPPLEGTIPEIEVLRREIEALPPDTRTAVLAAWRAILKAVATAMPPGFSAPSRGPQTEQVD